MLNSLRTASGSWLAKLLLIVLVLSFAAWGISGQTLNNIGGGGVVTAGDTTVSPIEYRLAYDRQISQLSQRFGTRITREQAVALGVESQVLAQLVSGAVLDEQARELGLGISKDKLAEYTASDPAFQGPGGSFDRQTFEYVLQQVGMRPADYIRNRAQVAKRQQIVEAVSDGLDAPDTLLRAVALYQGEDRTVEYVVMPRSMVEPIDDPSGEELSAWFEERKDDYAAPEYRSISYVKLEAEDIADPKVISDEQVRQYYEDNKNRYTTPERRTIEQIVFASEEAARAAYESLRSGTTFENLVEAQGKSLDDVRLGTFTKEDVADDAVAEAAFDLDENEISDVVDGSFGPVLVRVSGIEQASVQPYEEVEAEIRQELALDEANRILLDVHDSYEDARAGGDTLEEAAQKLDLPVRTVEAVDRNGQRPDGSVVDDLPESRDLLQEAFETEAEVENRPINTSNNGFVFYEVEEVTPERERTLDEVRERVVSEWKDAEAERRLSTLVEEYRRVLNDGTKTLDEIATEVGREKQVKRGLRRGVDDPDIGRGGVDVVFGVPRGESGSFPNPGGDARVLFEVTEVFEPVGAGPESLSEETRTALSTGIADDLLDQLVARLQARYEVTVNQSAIQQAMSF